MLSFLCPKCTINKGNTILFSIRGILHIWNLHYLSIRFDKFRSLVFLEGGVGSIYNFVKKKSINFFYMSLSLFRGLHLILYTPKLTFSFFLSVSNGCFAVTLRGVRTTSSSATSTVRPFGCIRNRKTCLLSNCLADQTKDLYSEKRIYYNQILPPTQIKKVSAWP